MINNSNVKHQNSVDLAFDEYKRVVRQCFEQSLDCDDLEFTPNEEKMILEEHKLEDKSQKLDFKRALDNSAKIFALLKDLSPNFTDQRFALNIGRKKVDFEQVKLQQKERFSRYDEEELLAQINSLDCEFSPMWEYTLNYVQGTLKKSTQVKTIDVVKLTPPNYLNDSLINFFLKFLEYELIPQSLSSKTYIFNTYFMEKLCPFERVTSTSESRLEDLFKGCFESVRRWVREDLFEKDYLLFPLNLPEHWSLLIVYKPMNIFTGGEAGVIYLDSFGIMENRLVQMIKMYLHRMYADRYACTKSYKESPISQMYSSQLLVPRQVNYVDCGLFLLEFAESFLENPDYLIDKDPNNVNKLALFPRSLVNRKRLLIKQLLVDLTKLSKEDAIDNYKNRRAEILASSKDNPDEYDQIDEELFAYYMQQRPSHPTQEQHRQYLLDFYMNPQHNYYHNAN